ncbi:coiled-coil domain-containing protein 124-like protein isoform X1 [Fagus crenata]
MPKKMGVNRKAEAARARKSATESERKERDAREKEEMYWSVQIWASKVRNTSWTSISHRTWNQYQRMRILWN